jgi:hypothetical protein
MEVIFDSYLGQVVPIETHMWWPLGTDGWYQFAPDEALARRIYYDPAVFNYVPSFRFDGRYIADPSDDQFVTYDDWYAWVRSTLDSLRAVPSPVTIELSQYPSADWDSVYVSIDITGVDDIPYTSHWMSSALYLTVTEDYHRYPFPQGKWRYGLREMIPSPDGYPLQINKGDTYHFDWNYPIDPVYNLDAIITNVFYEQLDTTMTQVIDTTQVPPDTSIVVERLSTVHQAAMARVVDVASVPPGETPVAAGAWLGPSTPNPFMAETRIAYSLRTAGAVRLSVYTPEGRLVANLVDSSLEPGAYSATWDGRDRFGSTVGSGMYYYKLDTGGEIRTGRMVFLK